jgi:hypothetical protein
MDPLTLRFAERLVAILIGGGAIYLGYRLFLEVPNARAGEGKFTFPWDASVVLTRVGPGVFFALFGALVVGTSFFKGIELQYARQRPPVVDANAAVASVPAAAIETFSFKGAGASAAGGDREARADARALLRRDIAILNNLPAALRTNLPEQDRSMIEPAISRIKLALMAPVWGEPSEGWGDVAKVEAWLASAQRDPPPAEIKSAVAYYRYGQAGAR